MKTKDADRQAGPHMSPNHLSAPSFLNCWMADLTPSPVALLNVATRM